jgi:hypothetical protein
VQEHRGAVGDGAAGDGGADGDASAGTGDDDDASVQGPAHVQMVGVTEVERT